MKHAITVLAALLLAFTVQAQDWNSSPDNWRNSPNNWRNSPDNWANSPDRWGNERIIRDSLGGPAGVCGAQGGWWRELLRLQRHPTGVSARLLMPIV